MRVHRLLLALSISGTLILSGCGDSKNNNGALTISSSETDQTTLSLIAFTITYTNPSTTNVIDTPIDVTTASPTITGANSSFSFNTNNSGTTTLTYLLPRDATNDQLFSISARTGDLVASKAVIVPKQGTVTTTASAMTALPTSITFSTTAVSGSSQNVIISGGSGSYSVLNVNPSPNPNVSAIVSGNTLVVTKTSSVTGGIATVLVIDTSSPPNSVSVTVNY